MVFGNNQRKTSTTRTPYRPKGFDELIGQEPTIEALRMLVHGYQNTGEPIRHSLFLGDSGLGKTTLTQALAAEMQVGFHDIAAGDVLTPVTLIDIFEKMRPADILFIDEMHNLPRPVQEWLLTVLPSFVYDDYDASGNLIKRRSPHFTLIGATTDAGELVAPLRMRFPYQHQLTRYTVTQLTKLVARRVQIDYPGVEISAEVAQKIATLSHNTAREAVNLLNLVYDVAKACPGGVCGTNLSMVNLKTALRQNGIDPLLGLNAMCRRYLVALLGEVGPVGESTIAALSGLKRRDVAEIIEPRLLQEKMLKIGDDDYLRGTLIRKTPRGRIATDMAAEYLMRCRAAQEKGWFPAETLRPVSVTADRVRADGTPI